MMIKNLLLAIFSICFFITAIGQQQPENTSFENWEDVGLTTDEPIDWSSIKTSDGGSWINNLAPYIWDQSSDAHTGNYSVRLFNANTIIGNAAGTVTNGRIHATISEGWAFTDPSDARWNTPVSIKPDSIVIWAKYTPAGTDIGQVKAVLHTGSAKIPDGTQTNYVATAEIYIPSAVTSWTRFSAPFTYLNGNDPEYILFVLSAADESATLVSEAWYDDIELIYNPVVLDLTLFLEGPYNGNYQMLTNLNPDLIPLSQPYSVAPWNYSGTESVTSIPSSDIVDWVLIEIRDAATANDASGFTTVGQQAGFLLKDGSVVGLDGSSRISFSNYINQNLFVVVWHRNHLGIMSAYPVTKTNGIHTYDFSDALDKIHGGSDGSVSLGFFGSGLWGMVSGDANANGTIELDDKTDFWSILVGKTGYLSSDYDLDTQINNADKNDFWHKNLDRESQVPQ